MKKLIADTNAYVRYLAGEEKILDYFAAADQIYLPVFVLGELFAGFRGGSKEQQNRRILDQFLGKSSVGVLEATRETAEYFGIIKAALKKAGRPIPLNDVWIAAQVLETGSVLATYDPHFLAVPGLRIWDALSESDR
jgi:tRNA(fMet)-specific endonuclease VapC